MSESARREWRFYLDDMIAFAQNVVVYTGGRFIWRTMQGIPTPCKGIFMARKTPVKAVSRSALVSPQAKPSPPASPPPRGYG